MAPLTKHEELAAVIRQRIGDGTYQDVLPSDADLVSEFGYSRATVRQAFTALENEGLIIARAGSRRRIRSQRRWDWPMATWETGHTQAEDAWAASIHDQGGQPKTEVTVHIERATPDVAQALQIDAGDQVVIRRRVRSVDGEPHQLADSHFPYWLAEKFPVFLQPGDLSAPGGLLASVGMPQARWADEITARMPTPEESRLLEATKGVPLLVHTRTGYSKQGQPVRHMITRMTADRVHVRYELDL